MDRDQEDMQFLGLRGLYLESYKIIFNFRKTFSKITLALILPLSFLYLAQIDVSDFLLRKIVRTEHQIDHAHEGTYWYSKLSDRLFSEWAWFWLVKLVYFTFLLIFSLLSTSAVVYTVASIYTGRDLTFKKVMSVVPKVWKRLVVTFLCTFLAFFLYNVIATITIVIWAFTLGQIDKVGTVFLVVISVLYVAGFVYLTLVWQLASVVSVLEDLKGFKAMAKSRVLIRGKTWIAVVVFFSLNASMMGIQVLFESQVVERRSLGVLGRLGLGLLCLLMLFKVFLFGLVIQTVIYFVCKSYHHENIDKSSLSDHLEVYLGEYVPLKTKDVQLEQFQV